MPSIFDLLANPIVPAPKEIQDLVSEVAGKVGVSPIPTALVDVRERGSLNARAQDRVNPETGKREFGIVFPPDAFSLFKTRANLSGVIAHELGHIAHDDMERMRAFSRQNETEADNFAAEHGYGHALWESFTLLPHEPTESDKRESAAGISSDHPATPERMNNVMRARKTARKA